VYVISGSLTVFVGPDKLTVDPGDIYHIPLHVPHTVLAGSEDTHAILISSPAGFAELVARAGTPAPPGHTETEPDLELFMAVTTELGDVTLGPPGMTPAELSRDGS
jgi:cupin domain